MPFDSPQQDDDSKYIVPPAGQPASHLNDLLDFAKRNNLPVGSTTTGTHNHGSKHYSGNAFDVRDSGSFTDDQVASLGEAARLAGFKLRDERVRPPGQAVWGGPHIHIEWTGAPQSEDARYFTVAQPPSDEDAKYVQQPGSLGDVQSGVKGEKSTVLERTPKTSVDVKPAEFDGATPQEPIEGQPLPKPIVFQQGREQPAEPLPLLNPVKDVYEALSKSDANPKGIAGLQAKKFETPDSHQLGDRVALPLSSHVTPSEDDVVRGYLSTLGPEYLKAGEQYKAQTGHNILTLGGGPLKQDDQGNYYVRPSRGAVDFINTYMQHGPDAALVEANRQADEYIGAQNKAFAESKSDVAEARAATDKAKDSATTRGLLATSGLAQAAGTLLPSDLGGREFLREAANLRAAQEQAEVEKPAKSLSTADQIKMGIGGLIPTAAMLIATHRLGPAQLAAMGVLEGSTPEERLRGGLQGAAAQGLLGGAPAAFEAAGIPKTGMATTSAAMVAQPAIEAWQRGDSPVQAITENLPFAALPFFMHAKFGKVQEVADQSGIPKGYLKVAEAVNPEATHVIIKPSTRRNMSAIPIREETQNAKQEQIQSEAGQTSQARSTVGGEAGNVPERGAVSGLRDGQQTEEAQQVTVPQRPTKAPSEPVTQSAQGAEQSAPTPGPPLRETVDHANNIKAAVQSGDTESLNRLLDEAGITDADIAVAAAKGQFNATTVPVREETQNATNREGQATANAVTVPTRDSAAQRSGVTELPNGQFQAIVDTTQGKVRQTFNTRAEAEATVGERAQLPSSVSSRGTFQSGLDPTKAFTADDLAAIKDKAKTVSTFLGRLREALRINRAKPVEKALGADVAADVMYAMHSHEAGSARFEAEQSRIYDKNFGEIEKWFDRLPSSARDSFNYLRGDPQTEAGRQLQRESQSNLRTELKNPKLIQTVKEASDWAYDYAKEKGFDDIDYFKDYFRGVFKDPVASDAFLDHWFSTEGFTKEKTWPTIADAAGAGLELKNNNPITNIKSEVVSIGRRAGLQELHDQVLDPSKPVPFITEPQSTAERAQLAAAGWRPIEDPVFKGAMADPTYARLVNTLLETNKFTASSPILWSLKQATRLGQTLKFMGSIYHLFTITKAAIADESFGMVDPRGYNKIIQSVTQSDRANPQYVDYINNGGGHRFSMESDTERLVTGSLNRIGNVLGVPNLGELGKAIPGSPANVHWQFETYIPQMKFQKYASEVADRQASLGRDLTKAEKQTIIRRNQEIYGEMNERLYGRSGTVTTMLRLPFTAPGFAEGNIRQIIRGLKGDPRTAGFVIKSLVASATAATLGTRILSGQWPPVPKSRDDVRDVFKIDTGQKDEHGNPIMLDTLTYDKDFWTVFGNLATLQPGKLPEAARSRLGGMESPLMRDFTKMATWMQTGALIDWKGDPIIKKEDPYSRQITEGSKELGKELLPIPGSTYDQFRQKGFGRPASLGMAIMGTRPATSEGVKSAQEKYYEEKRAKEVAPKGQSTVPIRAPRVSVPSRP